ncbi:MULTISPECIES: phage tail sheath protein [Rodentibacter]|uniref:Phage tail protein n=1 Tax=Rodentibacter pneumotropicus TaxID=758 RepID=A0A4S2QJ22_9PAST|nr:MULTISPECIES: phage tail sheath protein [Pasteurellaceae]TGY50818.1 phage tail sheath protein [Pasteurella caecimuris]THA00954.1 phage tail protein [Rodentibacter pneumotropicus]THA08186.1 phage tail protein [Rodentibacter pneumotropicus]THA09123.1 phage tail protein [Rodentibacter pneumotropicus]THA17250.1 phage tail protein [Rodentibacter pneumotropicus]
MSEEYLHGVKVTEISEALRTLTTSSTAVIGLVATAPDADNDTFPLNKPTLLTGITPSMIAKAGKTGTLSRALDGILDIVNCKVIVIRVEESDDESQMKANVIGGVDDEGNYTGLKAFLVSAAVCGVKPRIFCVPKYDSQDVTTELISVAQKLNGFVYASCYGCNTKEQAVTYRRQFSQRELMLIFGDFLSFNPHTKQTEIDYAVTRAAAMRAYQDKEFGWHTSISNKGLNGVTGVTKPLSFDINDSATDVNYLNEQGITACINYNGYKFWGLRTCSADKLFIYENYTRTAQVLKDTIAQSFDWAVDKDISVNLVKEIVEAINAKWREFVAKGYLVGGKAFINPELNTAATLKDAKLIVSYDYCPVPPLEQLGFNQYISDEYLVEFAANIAKVGA